MDFTDCLYAFEELTKAVSIGNVPAKVERVFRRLVFSDKMIPTIGNKYAFEEFLEKRKNGLYCVVDVNSFKLFNDLFGHKTGDEVIVQLGKAIRSASTDYLKSTNRRSKVFRVGGDEFVVFLESIIGYEIFFKILHERIFSLETIHHHKVSISLGCGTSYSVADDCLLKAKKIKQEFLKNNKADSQKLPNIFYGKIETLTKRNSRSITMILEH